MQQAQLPAKKNTKQSIMDKYFKYQEEKGKGKKASPQLESKQLGIQDEKHDAQQYWPGSAQAQRSYKLAEFKKAPTNL